MKEAEIKINCTIGTKSEMGLIFHEQLASGDFDGKEFRVIQGTASRKIRIEYQGFAADIPLDEFIEPVLERILDQMEPEAEAK